MASLVPEAFGRTRHVSGLIAARKELTLYIVKCVLGMGLLLGAYRLAGNHDYSWALISLVLVITPDSSHAMPLAVTRIKANTCAAAAALPVILIGMPEYAGFALAFVVALILCYLWDCMDGTRSALAATIIILSRQSGAHPWDIALNRGLSVFAGCLLGLVVTWVFDRALRFSREIKPGEISTHNE